ncbi:MAG TPA: heme-copper oxidase subunit III [Candidatus Acidoferrales bacterium]|nr:heme-copper oxidase subunit III [Candidatus Acidoferrales bacterium]
MSEHPRTSRFDFAGKNGGDGVRLLDASGLVPQRTYVTGMTMALGGILMFFMALVSAYVVRKGMPNSGWIAIPELPRILWLNTCVLVASSVALVFAHARFRAEDDPGFRRWWIVATALGIGFLAGQIIAWRELVERGVYLATNASSSFFYLFTAAHGLHLAGGIVALIWILLHPTRRLTRGTATEVAAMYWHFMDGIWLFLFLVLLVER